MLRSPLLPFAPVALVGLLVAGCGGGGSTAAPLTPDGAAKPIWVSGVVLEKDGETTDLAGIQLLLVEAGELAVTGADGAFAFADPAPGALTLRVLTPAGSTVSTKNGADDGAASVTESENETENEFEDDDADEREESSDDGVRVTGVQEGETVRVRIRIRDGQIVETRTSRSDGDEREAEIRLVRTPTNDDPDMQGEVELESRADREKFEVEVEHADPDRALELLVIDPDGLEESQGIRLVDALGKAEWQLASNDGERLPFAVAAVDDLADHTIEVRDATTDDVLLTVVLGELPASAPAIDDGSSDDDGSGSGGDEGERVHGRARLTASEAGLEGYVEVRRRADENRERFDVEVEHLAPGRVVSFYCEDPATTGTFLSLGQVAAGPDGEAELELRTNDGDMLPGNVATVLDLVGLEVQVRDPATDAVLLSGLVPTPVLDD